MKTETQHSADDNSKKLGELIKGIKFSMVTSSNSEGQLHSCPLTTQEVEFDGDLWFIVGKSSDVAQNIQNNSLVNASFSENGSYISASGSASIVDDRQKLEKFWNKAYEIWFPEGINDPNIGLLKISIESAEYWQSPSFKVVKLLAFAKAYITGDKKALGEHHKVSLN